MGWVKERTGKRPSRSSWAIVFLLLLILGAPRPAPAAAPTKPQFLRLAVMPFENLSKTSPDPDLQALTGGIPESLIQGLRNISALRIVERENMKNVLKEQAFAQTGMVDPKTAPKIGAILGANILMVGSFQVLGDQLRINARFIKADTGEVIQDKIFSVTGKWKEGAFQCMDELAQKFVASFNIQTTQAEKQVVSQAISSTKNYDAYTHYLKGRDHFLNFNHADFQQSIAAYKDALAIDGNYALAHAGLATTYYFLGLLDQLVGNEFLASYRLAEEHARRAVDLAPDQALGHLALSRVYADMNRSAPARQEVQTALRLNPGDPLARFQDVVLRANERLRTGGELPDLSGRAIALRAGPELEELEALKREAPKEALLFLFTGYNYTSLEMPAKGRGDLVRAVQLNPALGTVSHLVLSMGHIGGFMRYLNQGKRDKALKALDAADQELSRYAALDRGFKNPVVDIVRSLRLLAKQQLLPAVASLVKALNDYPRNKEILELIMRLTMQSRPDVAMQMANRLEAVLKEEADNGQIGSARKLGELYLEFGNPGQAIPYLQTFYQRMPNAQTRQLIQKAQMGGAMTPGMTTPPEEEGEEW